MGQKTPSPALRISLNRQYDLCWFKESKYYSDLFFKDFKYREYMQSICSQLPNLIYFSRIFSAAYPKKYNVHLFSCFQNQNQLVGNKISNIEKSKHSNINKGQIFQDFLSHKLRQAQFSSTTPTIVNEANTHTSIQQLNQSNQNVGSINNINPNLVDMANVSQKFTNCHTNIAILKTPHFESSAHFFNAILIQSFKKSNSYRHAIKNCLMLAQKSPHIAGIRITCAGRFNGVERARLETRSWGQTSLQQFNKHVDYSSKAALTNAGLLGIKVWVSYSNTHK